MVYCTDLNLLINVQTITPWFQVTPAQTKSKLVRIIGNLGRTCEPGVGELGRGVLHCAVKNEISLGNWNTGIPRSGQGRCSCTGHLKSVTSVKHNCFPKRECHKRCHSFPTENCGFNCLKVLEQPKSINTRKFQWFYTIYYERDAQG